MIKRFRVVGVAFMPVEVEMVVVAEDEAEAEAKALDLDCVSPYGAAIHREPRLGDFIVPNSEDPAAAFDFVANQIIPILET